MSLPSNIWFLFKFLFMRNAGFSAAIFGAMLFMAFPAQAMSDAHQQGMSLAQSIPLPQPGNPENVPGYAGTDLPQSQIKPHDLGEAAQRESLSNEGAQLIAENVEKGGRYVIDPHTDPLILAGNEVVNNPQKTLDDAIIEDEVAERGREEGKAEIILCEEAGDEYIQRCTRRLEITFKITPEKIVESRYCPGNIHGYGAGVRPWWCPSLQQLPCGGCMTSNTVIPEKVELVKEQWVDDCAHLEELSDKGLCRYQSKTTSSKNETRTIQRQQVKRDHFEEYFEYACLKASGKSCAGLRERGCYQINSVCKETIANTCVLWEQTYRCPAKRIGGKSYRSTNKDNPFCLSGDCVDKSYEANQDFTEVMSHMSVLKEAGDDFTKFGMIFKGVDRRCTRHCVDFKDCCGNGKGWGVSLSLASCDADEKELAVLREKKRCIQVGTYCAEKVLGVCIRKKTSFCCYGTKLAKIVQAQGKGQLGLDFGSPEHPQCQGLTPEQLSRIDFSRINFSDIFADIVGSVKTPDAEKIMSGIQKSMANKGSLLKPSIRGVKEEPVSSSQPEPSVESSATSDSGKGSGKRGPFIAQDMDPIEYFDGEIRQELTELRLTMSEYIENLQTNFDDPNLVVNSSDTPDELHQKAEQRSYLQNKLYVARLIAKKEPTLTGLVPNKSPALQPLPKVIPRVPQDSQTNGTDQPVVPSILNSPSASAMDDNFDISPEEARIWEQSVQDRTAAAIRSEDSRKKGSFGGRSTFSAYDEDFGSTSISPIVKPSTRPKPEQNSLIGKEEHVSKTLPDSLPKSENHQIQGRSHGEF